MATSGVGHVDVGIKDLRDGLSKHLDAVREGHTITVTDHGRPIARIVPLGVPTAFERLVAEGRISPAARPKRPSREPVEAGFTATEFIDEQRG